MTTTAKDAWKPQDQTAEVMYEQQSIAASRGQKVTAERQPAPQGPVPIPEF